VQLPTGEYFDDRLINLGTNRFMFRPQIGVQHQRRNWTLRSPARRRSTPKTIPS
jgi:hypothetical protein